MFRDTKSFSSFSTDDLAKAKQFYGQTLGLNVNETPEGLELKMSGGGEVFIYSKPSHQPATFTVLNFLVPDIDKAVDELRAAGVNFESYEGELKTDEKGVFRGGEKNQGPNIAWFKDPSGNTLSIVEEK